MYSIPKLALTWGWNLGYCHKLVVPTTPQPMSVNSQSGNGRDEVVMPEPWQTIERSHLLYLLYPDHFWPILTHFQKESSSRSTVVGEPLLLSSSSPFFVSFVHQPKIPNSHSSISFCHPSCSINNGLSCISPGNIAHSSSYVILCSSSSPFSSHRHWEATRRAQQYRLSVLYFNQGAPWLQNPHKKILKIQFISLTRWMTKSSTGCRTLQV